MENKNRIDPYRNFTIDKRDRFRVYGRQLFFFVINLGVLLLLLYKIVAGLIKNTSVYVLFSGLIPAISLLIVIFLVCIFLKSRVFNLVIAMLLAISVTITMAYFVWVFITIDKGFVSSYMKLLNDYPIQAIWESLPVLFVLFLWFYSFVAVHACLQSRILEVTYIQGITIESPTYEEFAEFFKNFYKPSILNDTVSDEDRMWLRRVDWHRGLSVLKIDEDIRGYSFIDYENKTILYVGVIGDDKWNNFYEDILVQDSLRRLTGKWVFCDQTLDSVSYKETIHTIQNYGWSIIHKDDKKTVLTFTPSAEYTP